MMKSFLKSKKTIGVLALLLLVFFISLFTPFSKKFFPWGSSYQVKISSLPSDPLDLSQIDRDFSNSQSTEAGFSFRCERCEGSKDIKNLCSEIISSNICQAVPENKRMVCGEEGGLKASDSIPILKKCLRPVFRTLNSFWSMGKAVWSILKYVAKLFIPSGSQGKGGFLKSAGASLNYMGTELYKAYSFLGQGPERVLNATVQVIGNSLSSLWSGVGDYIEKTYVSFACLKSRIKASVTCGLLVGVALNTFVPGGALLSNLSRLGITKASQLATVKKSLDSHLVRQASTRWNQVEKAVSQKTKVIQSQGLGKKVSNINKKIKERSSQPQSLGKRFVKGEAKKEVKSTARSQLKEGQTGEEDQNPEESDKEEEVELADDSFKEEEAQRALSSIKSSKEEN